MLDQYSSVRISKTEFSNTLYQMDASPVPVFSKTSRQSKLTASKTKKKLNKLSLSDSFGMDNYQQFMAMSKQNDVILEQSNSD